MINKRDILHGIANTPPQLKSSAKSTHGKNLHHTMKKSSKNWVMIYGTLTCRGCQSDPPTTKHRRAFSNYPLCDVCWHKIQDGDTTLALDILKRRLPIRKHIQPLDTEKIEHRGDSAIPPQSVKSYDRDIQNARYIRCSCGRGFITEVFKKETGCDNPRCGKPIPHDHPVSFNKYMSHISDARGKQYSGTHTITDYSDRNPYSMSAIQSRLGK